MKKKTIASIALAVGVCQTSKAGFIDDLVNFTAEQSQKRIAGPIVNNMAKQHHQKPPKWAKSSSDDDMPPEEHRDIWGRVESEHGACWYNKNTLKKICDPKP